MRRQGRVFSGFAAHVCLVISLSLLCTQPTASDLEESLDLRSVHGQEMTPARVANEDLYCQPNLSFGRACPTRT